MTVSALGTLTIGAALPGVGVAVSAGADGLGLVLPDVAARLEALAAAFAALAALPPVVDFSATLAGAQLNLASIQLALSTLALTPPDMTAALAAITAQLGQIEAMLSSITAKVAIIANFQVLLSAGAIAAYAFDGSKGALGSELGAAIGPGSPGSTHANALVLYTEDASTWSTMGGVFKVSP